MAAVLVFNADSPNQYGAIVAHWRRSGVTRPPWPRAFPLLSPLRWFLLVVVVAMLALTGTATTAAAPGSRQCVVSTAFREDCEKVLLREVAAARQTILVAVYTFTNRRVARALLEAAQRDVKVQVKIDRVQAGNDFGKPIVNMLRGGGVSVITVGMPEYAKMHHKFMVLDNRKVLTGSYNYTVTATAENCENLVLIESEAVAREFLREYARIKSRKK